MKTHLHKEITFLLLFFFPLVYFTQTITLGSAANFALFTSVGAITNVGSSQVSGDVGSNSGAITGFGNVNGNIQSSNAITALAVTDLGIAYSQLNMATPGFFLASPIGNGSTLTAGVYSISGNTVLNNTLTLNAQGSATAVFIFHISGTFSSNALSKIVLINGAQACQVYFKVEGLLSLANGSDLKGNLIVNNAAITIGTGVLLEGRVMSTTGAISVTSAKVNTPVGCGSPYLTGPAAPSLASSNAYALFSSNGAVSNSGVTTVTGDIGSNYGSSIGFNPILVDGFIHPIPDLSTGTCAFDLSNVYTYLNGLPADINLVYPAQFGNNLVLTPHTYVMNGAVTLTDSLYLNAEGNENAIFVIQINGAMSTSGAAKVILINGAQSNNVFWKVDGAVSLNANAIFRGTIICNNAAISLANGVFLDGRALTTTGALSTVGSTVAIPFDKIKTSIANGNWSDPAVWNPWGIPLSSHKIFVNHVISLDNSFSATDTIFVTGTLNLSTSSILNLGNGYMVLVNDSLSDGKIGSVGMAANIIGEFNFQKWVSRCDGFSTYGSPFTVPKTDFDWYYCYQCMGPNWSNLYYYDESVPGMFDLGYYDNIGPDIIRGKGFFYWFSNYTGGLNFDRKVSLNGAIDFTSPFNFNISRTDYGNALDDGFNLVSNPFPGTIDWLSSEWSKMDILDAIYVWNSCTDTYASYIGGVGVNGGTNYIPSMQGFWIQANGPNPKLAINSGVLSSHTSGLLKSNAITDTVNYVLRIHLETDEIAIRLDANSSSNLDPLSDALKMKTEQSKICSSMYPDSAEYSINSIADSTAIVFVKIKGSGTLSFTGIPGFFNRYALYLKDLLLNSYQPIYEGMLYDFTDTSTVTFQKRFEIHFIKTDLVDIPKLMASGPSIICDEYLINIVLPQRMDLPVNITMSNLLGGNVFHQSFNQKEISIPKLNMPVIITITNKEDRWVKKIF